MSLRSALQHAGNQEPRAVKLIRDRDEGPMGKKPLSDLQISRRLEPILPMIMSGEISVPDEMAPAVERALERMRKQDDSAD